MQSINKAFYPKPGLILLLCTLVPDSGQFAYPGAIYIGATNIIKSVNKLD